MKIILGVIRETIFMSCLFVVSAVWLHRIEEAYFSFILHSEMLGEVQNLTKMSEIVRMQAKNF